MAFIRKKQVKGKLYYQLVENFRDKDTGKVKQRIIKHLGTNPDSLDELTKLKKQNQELKQKLDELSLDLETMPKTYETALKAISFWNKTSLIDYQRAADTLNLYAIPTARNVLWDKNKVKKIVDKLIGKPKKQGIGSRDFLEKNPRFAIVDVDCEVIPDN